MNAIARAPRAAAAAAARNGRLRCPGRCSGRRYESSSSKPSKTVSNEEAIRATKEAIQALKDAKTRTASQVIVEGAQTSKKQQHVEPSLWTRLRTPVLFGTGLYLGLALFGEHREIKRESGYFAELKANFEGSSSTDKKA